METSNIRKATSADVVYEKMKNDIVTLFFKPGEKLSETRLAARYGVSRDPVRKAVSRLAQEGMLESKPQVGTLVKGLSIEQGKDVCDLRSLLECYAIERAVNTIGEEIIDSLLKEYDQVVALLSIQPEDSVRSQIYDLDGKMHREIYAASSNSMVAETINSFSSIIKRIQISNITYHKRANATLSEMHEIILALKARDPQRAVTAMRTHIDNIKKTMAMPVDVFTQEEN